MNYQFILGSRIVVVSAVLVILASCQKTTGEVKTISHPDRHTYAKPDAVITHLYLDVDVNFDLEIIEGVASFDIRTSHDASQLILDTKNLDIRKVTISDGADPVQFSLGEPHQHMGQALTIPITPVTQKVQIHYQTTAGAEALQWLNPIQTADKTDPFLFTQSQAILARSWIPIQDSPGIRFTYSARVTVPPGLMALMSAENPTQTNENGEYTFQMNQPIPAYLMALSVGNVTFAPIGQRTGVYAEPSVIEAAIYEFGEMEDMLVAAERLYGPYRWVRYDLIILPPSFPFGGMENPRLTFATPTIIAGDRSLTSLVAHELAHSWSGNLVTNATWDDFWLNEGFTVYFEQRIMEELFGRSYAEMLAQLSKNALEDDIEEFIAGGKADDTKLKLDLNGRNPDDGVTSVPYDKGYLFLRWIEESVGREKFDSFLKQYFAKKAFQVMTTESFLEYLKTQLFEAQELEYDSGAVNVWVYGQGLPANCPNPSSGRFELVTAKLNSMISGAPVTADGTKEWSSHEWLFFITSLPQGMTPQKMKELDDVFEFTASSNSEIAAAWLEKAISVKYEAAYPRLEEFLVQTGRRKFLVPLYSAMVRTDEGKEMALNIYQKARSNYHFVSTNTIDDLLEWK